MATIEGLFMPVGAIMAGSVIRLADGTQGVLAEYPPGELSDGVDAQASRALIDEHGELWPLTAADVAEVRVSAVKLLTVAYRAYLLSQKAQSMAGQAATPKRVSISAIRKSKRK